MSQNSQVIDNLFQTINLLESSPPNLNEVIAKIRESILLLQNGQTKMDDNSKGTIKSLPNELLLMIFKYISTQQLLHLRLCCSRWKLLIEPMYGHKRSLKLLFKDQLLDYWKRTMPVVGLMEPVQFNRMRLYSAGRDDDLVFNLNFRMQHCSVIARLFPNIQHLTVCLNYILPALPKLLSKMPQLISLSLYGPIGKGISKQFYQAIRSLSSLRNLDLMCNSLCPKGYWEDRLPLDQLEHFSFGGRYEQFELVSKIGPNCTSLLINSPNWVERFRANYDFGSMPINVQARSNITHLTATNIDCSKMTAICKTLVNLKYLNISGTFGTKWKSASIYFEFALPQATSLKHLEQLRIFVDTLESWVSTYNTVNVSTTVKTLKLGWSKLGRNFNVVQLGKTLSTYLPNVETIIFEHNDKPLEIDEHFTSQFSRLKQCLVDCDKIEYLGRHKEWYLKNVLKQKIKCLKVDVEDNVDTSDSELSDNDQQ